MNRYGLVVRRRGGCWENVTAYAADAKIESLTASQRALKRTCGSVALILEMGKSLPEPASAA